MATPSEAKTPGLPARRAAMRLLDAVLRRGEPMEHAQHGATQGLKDRADKALAVAIAAETLRWLADLDGIIDARTHAILPEDAKARMVLRIALVQALVLETPAHAAISTALPLVSGGQRRLVHGVFGSAMREEVKLPDVPQLPPEADARWRAVWGDEVAQAACVALAHSPPLDLSLRDPSQTDSWCDRLEGRSLAPGHVRVDRAGAVEAMPGFSEGAWWVQDLAATIPVRLLGEGGGSGVLDLCAAPGGKTMQLAAAGWQVTALDSSLNRLERLQRNCKRTGFDVTTVVADVLSWEPDAPVAAILLDAPCSATGIFRRHPDVLYRTGEREVAALAELQAAMLERALGWLKPGGSLIYATCSLEPLEGEEQVKRSLVAHPECALAPSAAPLPEGISASTEGWVRTLPGMLADTGGLDGFFAARLVRGE